ncbi:MAG: class I SAM-dependent methyltransferase [Candidatus Omnitrophota bacterium]
MRDRPFLDAVRSHSSVWEKWLEDKDLNKRVYASIRDRRYFLGILKRELSRRSGIKKSGAILEEGCGTAIDSCLLKREFPYAAFYAIDLSREAVLLASKISGLLGAPITVTEDDATATRFAPGHFDLIFSQGLMEHFRAPELLLLEQRRILKDGGISVVSVPQRYSLFTILKKSKMALGRWPHGWEREYSFSEMASLGEASGFRVIGIDGYGFTLEDFVKNGVRRLGDNGVSRALIDLSDAVFSLIESSLGKPLRKRICKHIVAILEK